MSKNEDNIHKKAVYLPNNEPYLGRESVFQFERDKGDGSIQKIKGTVLFILTEDKIGDKL